MPEGAEGPGPAYAAELLLEDEVEEDEPVDEDDDEPEEDDVEDDGLEDDAGLLLDEEPRLSFR